MYYPKNRHYNNYSSYTYCNSYKWNYTYYRNKT
jgi:hypothetical protein